MTTLPASHGGRGAGAGEAGSLTCSRRQTDREVPQKHGRIVLISVKRELLKKYTFYSECYFRGCLGNSHFTGP